MEPTILSLCDYSGAWCRPFIDAGINCILVDPKHGNITYGGRGLIAGQRGFAGLVKAGPRLYYMPCTVGTLRQYLHVNGPGALNMNIVGILAAPPCTDFSSSGARWFAEKDLDGRTAQSVAIVSDILDIIRLIKPLFYAIENPVGRLASLVPGIGRPRLLFNPCNYAGFAPVPEAEAYTKKTCLFGEFNPALPLAHLEPVYYTKAGKRGSWMWANLGGNSERTKALRSTTPSGFARAFCSAQLQQFGDQFGYKPAPLPKITGTNTGFGVIN